MPDFEQFAEQLRRAGVARRVIGRSVDELGEHYDALVCEIQARGVDRDAAKTEAAQRLGDLQLIARQIAARSELKCWYFRWPLLARIALPVACFAVLPVTPVIAGVQHASGLLRWSCCLLMGGVVTVLLIGIMQLPMQLD